MISFASQIISVARWYPRNKDVKERPGNKDIP